MTDIFEQMFKPETLERMDYLGDGMMAVYTPYFKESVVEKLSHVLFKVKTSPQIKDVNPLLVALFEPSKDNPNKAELFNKVDSFLKECENDVPLNERTVEFDFTMLSHGAGFEIVYYPNPIWQKENNGYSMGRNDNVHAKIVFLFNIFNDEKGIIELDWEQLEWVIPKS